MIQQTREAVTKKYCEDKKGAKGEESLKKIEQQYKTELAKLSHTEEADRLERYKLLKRYVKDSSAALEASFKAQKT